MIPFKQMFLALALVLAPGAALAQETAATPEAQDPQRPYTRETIGDWALQCLPRETPEQEPCDMYQLLRDAQGTPVMEVEVFRLEGRGIIVAGANVTVPLETLLTEKLAIQVDGGKTRKYDFSFCTQFGCYARVGLTEEELTQFKKGAVARMSIVPALAPDKVVSVDLSLRGFTASFAKVSSRN